MRYQLNRKNVRLVSSNLDTSHRDKLASCTPKKIELSHCFDMVRDNQDGDSNEIVCIFFWVWYEIYLRERSPGVFGVYISYVF